MAISSSSPWVLIAANPYSGRLANARRVEHLAAEIESHQIQARIVWDRNERKTLLADPELPRNCRCIVVAGGDGTVADVLNEKPDVPLAIFPLGTENLLAKYLSFTSGPAAVANAIARGECWTLDLGWVWRAADEAARPGGAAGGRRFSLMVSAGMDADVVHRLHAWRSSHHVLRRVHHFSYFRPLLKTMRQYRYEPIELQVDGRRIQAAGAMIFNLPCYGGGLKIAPAATGDDGQLDWVTFEKPGTFKALDYLQSILLHRHTRRTDVQHGRAKRIRLVSRNPVPVQIDGDAAGFTPIEVEVQPQSLRVIRGKVPGV